MTNSLEKENIHKEPVDDFVYRLIDDLSNDSYISLHKKRDCCID